MLNLAFNALTGLPSSLKELKSLRLLNLRGNRLTEVSDELCTLPALEVLNLRENHIPHLTFTMLLAILCLDIINSV